MKRYKDIIARINAKSYSRSDLTRLRVNAERLLKEGDEAAQEVLDALPNAVPTDEYFVFMGFCPGADFANRLDVEWKRQSICTFQFLESPQQMDRFNSILPGDLIVLKKREKFGKTMQLYGFGRVKGYRYDTDGTRFLEMDWANQDEVIEVPLMGCNSTVDVRTVEAVTAEMPDYFFSWLGKQPT